jgi:hypothetical protein
LHQLFFIRLNIVFLSLKQILSDLSQENSDLNIPSQIQTWFSRCRHGGGGGATRKRSTSAQRVQTGAGFLFTDFGLFFCFSFPSIVFCFHDFRPAPDSSSPYAGSFFRFSPGIVFCFQKGGDRVLLLGDRQWLWFSLAAPPPKVVVVFFCSCVSLCCVLVFRYCRRWYGGDIFCCCRSGFGFNVCLLLFGGGVWLVIVWLVFLILLDFAVMLFWLRFWLGFGCWVI